MKTEGQIRQQLKQVVFRHLQRRMKAAFRRIPASCVNNEVSGKIGICGLLSKDLVVVCDADVEGGAERAKACPHWKPRKTRAEMKDEFRELVKSGDKGRIAAQYPDVAALLWVLDGFEGIAGDLDDAVDGRPPEQTSDAPTALDLAGAGDDEGGKDEQPA